MGTMYREIFTITKAVQRRFILGKQGLYPGRRWRGKRGALKALQSGSVVQVDPLQVVAHNHDLSLFSRVLDYTPAQLDELLYEDRACFEYGGTVMIHPIEQLPYLRVVMARKAHENRWGDFLKTHQRAIERVRLEINERGPLSSLDIEPEVRQKTRWWSGKDTGRALYYLWATGELLINNRNGTGKVFDMRERIAPPHLSHAESETASDDHFAIQAFRQLNIATAQAWRNWYSGMIERRVDPDEASERLEEMEGKGIIRKVMLEGEPKIPRFVLVVDLPELEMLSVGRIPDDWQPLQTTTSQETTFLAPLEVVSARGRAARVFDFDYVWEVYKPANKRRWGYYTLPILYGDRLVARFDSKLERSTRKLLVRGFWLEEGQKLDRCFKGALKAGFKRFMSFTGAERIDCSESVSPDVGEMLVKLKN
jgi:uncharacterized protein YcaQ